jgi:glycosyltransferase involved in cell wall biosynthesis
MKIALYMTTVLNYGGGLEKYLIDTAAKLYSHDKVERIDIFSMDDNFTNRITDLLGIFYFKKRDRKLNFKLTDASIKEQLGEANYHKCSTFKELRSRLNEYDVVYSKNELIDTFFLRFFIKYNSIPPVILGGHTPLKYPIATSMHSRLHNFLYSSFIYKFLADPAARYHALNSYEEKNYLELFKKGVFRIPNPFDLNNFLSNVKANIFKLESKSNKFNIMWLGRLTEQKGIDDLIKVIEKVNIDYKDKIQWNIFGDGEQKNMVLQLEKKHENIKYYGHINPELVPSIYTQHDAYISTSKWEGYPYTILEAVAAGTICIAYNIPGTEDILKLYNNGYLVNSSDEMAAKIVEVISLQKKESNVPKEIFDQDHIYDQLINLFNINL